jgi:dTDP-4-dehydrorhamnose reductase
MGCWLAVAQDAEGIYHISSRDILTPYDMALLVAEYFKLDTSYIKEANASNFSQTARRPARTGFDISKAEDELGFTPHTFTEGIAVVASQL